MSAAEWREVLSRPVPKAERAWVAEGDQRDLSQRVRKRSPGPIMHARSSNSRLT
jgi:hypothetical protein